MGCLFFAIYGLVMLPACIALLAIAAVSLRTEGRLLHTWLAADRAAGILTDDDYHALCSVRGRLDASMSALLCHGWAAWRRRRVFHQTASELAFLRHRVADGDEAANPALEHEYLDTLLAYYGKPPIASEPIPPAAATLSS